MTTVLQSLNAGLRCALEQNERVVLLGEDVLDPYGGAFKVTRGLSSDFPGRVLTTPISEAAITGMGAGMALRGLRPVVELMFGDFVTLAADQLINHAAKFRWMYNEQVRVPLVVRTPMGGRRGYGPTHSQTLEKHFLGVPGLRVLAPCALQPGGEFPGISANRRTGDDAINRPRADHLSIKVPDNTGMGRSLDPLPPKVRNDAAAPLPEGPPGRLTDYETTRLLRGPGELLAYAILDGEDPTLFIENKLLYLLPVLGPGELEDLEMQVVQTRPAEPDPDGAGALTPLGYAPTFRLSLAGAPPPTLTLTAYGYMAELARQALVRLAYEHEIFAELIVPTQLAPFDPAPLLASLRRTGALLAIEEGGLTLGWGAEVLARAAETPGLRLRAARRVAALDLPIPSSGALEALVLPDIERICRAATAF